MLGIYIHDTDKYVLQLVKSHINIHEMLICVGNCPTQWLLSFVPPAGNFYDFKKKQEEHLRIMFVSVAAV